jgi:CUG-BP- and ETR3-like factor
LILHLPLLFSHKRVFLIVPVPENKLFVGMLSRKAGESEIRELFAPFGEIREIYMIRNPDGSSKCAAFLRYVKREAAVAAIDSLNNNLLMEGCARPLIVKFADNKHQRQQRQVRNVRRQEGMVNMGGPAYAAYSPQVPAAYAPQGPPQMAMPGHHPGAGPQYPLSPHQYGPATYGPGAQQVPQATYGPGPGAQQAAQPLHPYMYPPYAYATPPQYASPPPGPPPSRQEGRQSNATRPREGPAGANLFVYHLPHDLTDADLATAFNPFGNVISAKVYVDKYTGESKGFGKFALHGYACQNLYLALYRSLI